MPYSAVHFELAKRRKKLFKEVGDLDDFIVGSLLVDSSYILEQQNIKISREQTHYHLGENYQNADFSKNFYTQEYLDHQNYLLLGYYYHLEIDFLWRDSDFIQVLYKNPTLEPLYQLSRKYYSWQDMESMLRCSRTRKIISRLYDYQFEEKKLPKIYQSIPIKILNTTLRELLDYMTGEKAFYKASEMRSGYSLEKGIFHISDEKLIKQLRKYFPKAKYNALKENGLKIFDDTVFSQVKYLESRKVSSVPF